MNLHTFLGKMERRPHRIPGNFVGFSFLFHKKYPTRHNSQTDSKREDVTFPCKSYLTELCGAERERERGDVSKAARSHSRETGRRRRDSSLSLHCGRSWLEFFQMYIQFWERRVAKKCSISPHVADISICVTRVSRPLMSKMEGKVSNTSVTHSYFLSRSGKDGNVPTNRYTHML